MAERTEKRKVEKNITKEIEIPGEIEIVIEKNIVTMKKDNKELKKEIDSNVDVKKEGNKILLSIKEAKRNQKRELGTSVGHIKNMIEGLKKDFEYELEMCNVHFPMTVTFDKSKSEFIIKNLLGEKSPRILKASNKIEAEIKAPHIKIKSYDIEAAGQTAADLEKVTKIKNRDRNKFQDGIFITKKPGKSYL
jgi:large subunit ribosomal protein L6